MTQYTNFLALVLIYFLIIYLTAIRRGGQRVLPWILRILAQAASLYYFRTLCVYVSAIPFFTQYPKQFCMYMTAGALILVNVLLIFLLNIAFSPRQQSRDTTDEFYVDVDSLPLSHENTEQTRTMDRQEASKGKAQNPLKEDTKAPLEEKAVGSPDPLDKGPLEPLSVEPQDQIDVLTPPSPNTSDFSEDVCDIDMDEEALFLTIQQLIDDYKISEASKYLRMVALFGTNPVSIQKAKQILAEIQPNEQKVKS